MSRRSRTTAVRLGAGALLAAACVIAPGAAQAAPVDGPVPQQGPICTNPSVSLSSSEVVVGESVTVTGECFAEWETVKLQISNTSERPLPANGSGTVSTQIHLDKPGTYTIALASAKGTAYAELIVTGPPADEDEGNPDNGGDNSGGDNTGGDNTGGDNTGGDNTGGDNTGGDNTGGDNTGGDNTGGDNTGGDNTGRDNTGGGSDQGTPSPTKPFPGSNDDDAPAPSAGGERPARPNRGAELPAAPETATRDFAGSGTKQTPERQGPSPAVAMRLGNALLGAFGPDATGGAGNGAESTDSNGSGDELAETGIEVSTGATFAALAMGAGAGMLWFQRRRSED